jgi:hypothetical protein
MDKMPLTAMIAAIPIVLLGGVLLRLAAHLAFSHRTSWARATVAAAALAILWLCVVFLLGAAFGGAGLAVGLVVATLAVPVVLGPALGLSIARAAGVWATLLALWLIALPILAGVLSAAVAVILG